MPGLAQGSTAFSSHWMLWTFWCLPRSSHTSGVLANLFLQKSLQTMRKHIMSNCFHRQLLTSFAVFQEQVLLTSICCLSDPFIPCNWSRERHKKTYTGSYVLPWKNVTSTLQGSAPPFAYLCLLPVMWHSKWKIWLKTSLNNTSQQWPPLILPFFFI